MQKLSKDAGFKAELVAFHFRASRRNGRPSFGAAGETQAKMSSLDAPARFSF